MPYRILTFDGGGICGLFTARVLHRIQAAEPALLQNVDLLAGTSTGGIIAVLLAAGHAPSDVADLYQQHADDIFDDSVWDDLLDMGKAVGADYSNKKLKRHLVRVIGGDTALRDLSKRVLVPSFDLDDYDEDNQVRSWKPKFFHNFKGADSDGDQLAVDVCLRTSAAPTFFPAYQGYIDGGVVANNPSVAALAAALDPRNKTNAEFADISLLSLGTGADAKYIRGENLDWGWGQWARPMIQIMLSGVMGVAHFQCKQLLGDRYLRLDRLFDRPVALDETKSASLQYLVDQADAMDLDPVLDWIGKNWA